MADSFKILYFATAETYTGKSEETLPAPLSVSKLFSLLEERYPGIRNKVLVSCAVTVNLDYIDLDEAGKLEIKAGDEVGIIPPCSAG